MESAQARRLVQSAINSIGELAEGAAQTQLSKAQGFLFHCCEGDELDFRRVQVAAGIIHRVGVFLLKISSRLRRLRHCGQ